MEAIVERIVEKCIQSELIEESQRDWMAYSLQRKFMNFGGFFILVCFGTLVAPLPQVILLNFGLALLREKTNGLHMPTVFSCFITSLFCEYACLYLIDRLQSSTIAAAITLFIVSAMLILILAPCNNSAMHCSNEELPGHENSGTQKTCIILLDYSGPFIAETIVQHCLDCSCSCGCSSTGFG